MSLQAVRRRVRSGVWAEVHPAVYLVAGHEFTRRGRVRAAWLWAGPDAIVDGTAAAFWFGMTDRPPPVVGVTVPPRTRRTPPDGIRMRRRTVPAPDRARRDGIALTGKALTVLETAAVHPDGITFLDRALQVSVTAGDLYAAYCRNAGAHGMRRARAMFVSAADAAESVTERRLVAGLRRAGIEGFVQGLPLGDWKIDIAFPAARLAVEIDSWAWHTDPVRFARDRAKGNAIVAAGWRLLRFTWRDVTEHPDRCVDLIRSELARAA
ncbi:very-short-patch-repair endonuclease [Pseudonocardia endophytica]|uniref:Very-short-patch-repair endonuclease n=1 Tax=Pseudonocardia endophytica TaxID=401976 RepID=A0A4R1HNC4_PSEEN|nr:very-short-patch-repair endonuclease [Pseudonocardia endophytica]